MRIIIAGGGASGLFAAYTIACHYHRHSADMTKPDITVLDANDVLGKKILSTGNGRCNLCNTDTDASKYYCEDNLFVKKILAQFHYSDAMKAFNRMGVALKDKGGYVYPRSMQAATISSALINACRLLGVKLINNCVIKSITCVDSSNDSSSAGKAYNRHEKNNIFCIEADKSTYYADCVILAYGSNAGITTDYTGTVMKSVKSLGHKLHTYLPSLCSLYVDMTKKHYADFFKKSSGVRTDIVVKAENYSYAGELQITNYGLSGIVIFQISHIVSESLYQKKKREVKLYVDFLASYESTDVCRLLRTQHFYEKRTLLDLISGILNGKLALALIQLYSAMINRQITPDVKNISEEELLEVISFMKNVSFYVNKTNDIAHAQVCMGGVATQELTDNLESRLIENLYFCGECIDVDGICGGYNLMWAWATGYVVGRGIANREWKPA